jgi:hypothetical protein
MYKARAHVHVESLIDVHNATQHTRAIAEAAAAEVASTDGASAQAQMTEDMMHDIADLIY